MSKIKIKNFGPIKEGYVEDDGFLDIKKVTIFIGNQGSGKSTVAKLISTMMWLEKALNRGDIESIDHLGFKSFISYHGIDSYFKVKSDIRFVGDRFYLSYVDRNSTLAQDAASSYKSPKIIYIPAERNVLSTTSNLKGLSDNVLTFYEEFRRASKELSGQQLQLPINNYSYLYDEKNETGYVVGDDYKIDMRVASSGIQSLTPLFVVANNLANLVTQSDDVIRRNMNAGSIFDYNFEMAQLEANDEIDETTKNLKRQEIKDRYLPKCFINIVEEPEQNLYPSSQRHILNSLLEFNNQSDGNKLIMTTHSPYIINYLSLAIYAGSLKDKIHSKELMDKLHAIVPLQSTIQASDVAIYQLDERDGTIRKLPSFEGIPSDQNYLNQSLAEGNELFDSLLEIEQEL